MIKGTAKTRALLSDSSEHCWAEVSQGCAGGGVWFLIVDHVSRPDQCCHYNCISVLRTKLFNGADLWTPAILFNISTLRCLMLGTEYKYHSANALLFFWLSHILEGLALRLVSRRNHWPSSSARLCWGQLKSWWRTRMEATPQISTSCTGRIACPLACILSAAWRWWQSQYKPSVWWKDKTKTDSAWILSLIQELHLFHNRWEKGWKTKFKNMKDSWHATRGFP